MALILNSSWTLRATAQYTDTNNNSIKSQIAGRFNPETITGTDIQNIIARMLSMTTNTYVDANLTVNKIILAGD